MEIQLTPKKTPDKFQPDVFLLRVQNAGVLLKRRLLGFVTKRVILPLAIFYPPSHCVPARPPTGNQS